MKTKERILKDKSGKPDPMQRAAGLSRDIARLNTQIETAVMTPPFICTERNWEDALAALPWFINDTPAESEACTTGHLGTSIHPMMVQITAGPF